MLRRIRPVVLTLVFALMLGGMDVHAVTIGELLGWGTDREEETSGKEGGLPDISGDQTGGEDDYETLQIDRDASYDTKDEVCAYLVQFGCLPPNYMTKKEARKAGWESGALDEVIPGRCIGGDVFGNYEEQLPVVSGRVYHECDIDTIGREKRGARRIVYSGDDENDDWNIYYTGDHYETFELLWGEDDYD